MKEVKKVSAALRAVERWEEYLFRRALGCTFIVWAAVVAVAGFVTLKAEAIASAIEIDMGALIGFTWLAALLIALPITVYFFASAGRAFARMRPLQRHEKAWFAVIWILWGVLMFTAGNMGRYIGPGSAWPLFIGIANVLTYAVTRARGGGYPEQLLVGVMLVVAAPVVYAIGAGEMASEIAYLSGLAAIVLAYSVGGMYSLWAAARALVGETRPHGS